MAVVGKFPTQHWELEAEEHQEMMLNVLGGFYKKTNKLKDVPEKKCFATTCNVVRLESTFAPNGLHSANPPCTTECPRCHRSTPGSSQAPPQQRLASVLAATDGTMLAYKIPVPRAG